MTRVEVRTTETTEGGGQLSVASVDRQPGRIEQTHELPPGSRVPLGAMVRVDAVQTRVGATDMRFMGRPVMSVSLAAFEIDVTEVTTEAYQSCIDLGVCTPPNRGEGCNYQLRGRERHPINCVKVEQAEAYCSFVDKRLPTEDEWEVAARGNDFRLFPWGNDAPPHAASREVCWNRNAVSRSTCRAGRSPGDVSAVGALDMAGNVMEWTATQQCGADECEDQPPAVVYRGGAWGTHQARDLRTARRHLGRSPQEAPYIGFRCAR